MKATMKICVAALMVATSVAGVAAADEILGGLYASEPQTSESLHLRLCCEALPVEYRYHLSDVGVVWQFDKAWREVRLNDWTSQLGTTFTNSMATQLSSPRLSLDLDARSFTRAGIDYSQELSAGIDYKAGRRFSLRLGIDAAYLETPRDAGDPFLSQIGIDAANDSRSRWAFPVSAALTYRMN